MAPSENPQTPPLIKETPAPIGLQTSGEASPVPLPPLPQLPAGDTTKFLRLRSWLDAPLVFVVVLFAFLVASFPAHNSDFFRQTALGRLIVQGQYHFGVDPFVYSAGENDYFVNHSWLFALLMYGLYQLPAGGAVVVLFKALVIAALAGILLRASHRAGQSLWLPAVCTALAILVASPRFLLQSSCLSFLFLGVTIAVVFRGEKRLWWLLPPLFALWINCDSWFFLGPLTVALYLAGAWIRSQTGTVDTKPPADPRALRTLGWVLIFGAAACLINPHHVRAFTLPAEFGLTPAGDLLQDDFQFYPLFLSPLGKEYYKPYFGLSVAGLAYWPLMLLSLFSFVLVCKSMPWPRLLVWTSFALMSLYNWRTIPFFAIVAGPITAWNGLDFASQRFGSEPRLTPGWRRWSLAGRVLTLLLGLVLLLVTVPGWLQKSQPNFHRIGWSVPIDPSLHEMAQTIRNWRVAGLLPEEPHWFNTYSEIANYLAWFAPGERAFLDQSLLYFREAAEDYLDVRRGLEQMAPEQSESEGDAVFVKIDWRKVLRERGVRFWIYDALSARKADLVARLVLFANPEEWVPCYLKGRIAIFAWRDPRQPASAPPARLTLDFKQSAFGANAEPAPPHGAEPAPPGNWWNICWQLWWRPEPPLSSDRESVALYDSRYQALERPREIYKYSRAWQTAVAAGAVASSLPHGPVPNSLLMWSWSCTYHDLFPPGAAEPTRPLLPSEEPAMQARAFYVNSQFIEPPSLYLAVRAARRALRIDPEDGPTYFRLAQIYQHLRELPQESQLRRLPPQLSPRLLDAIRRTQMAAAYQNCLRLQPDDDKAAQAHEALFWLYFRELGYIDAAVSHLRQVLDKRSALGPPLGTSPTQYNRMLDQMSAELTRLDGELERRRDRYEVKAAGKTGLEKVQIALQEGLSETALTLLEQEADIKVNNPAEFSVVKVVTGAALDLGKLDKAQQLLPDQENQPVKPEDLELYLRLAAARGDYAEADRLLDDTLQQAWQPGKPAFAAAAAIGRALLTEAQIAVDTPRIPSLNPLLLSNFWARRWSLDAVFNGLLSAQQQAEWYLIRGWLALEAGHCLEARKYFEIVRDITVPFSNWAPEVDRLNVWLDPQAEITGMRQVGFRHETLHNQSKRYLKWLAEKPAP